MFLFESQGEEIRVPFRSIFHKTKDGYIETNMQIRVGGVIVKKGFRAKGKLFIGGIDIFDSNIFDHDLQIVQDGKTIVITGIY